MSRKSNGLGGAGQWLSVLKWWWARPKSLGMTIIVLLVAGALYLAERGGLIGGDRDLAVAQSEDVRSEEAQSRTPRPAGDSPKPASRDAREQSVEWLVGATQAETGSSPPSSDPAKSGSGSTSGSGQNGPSSSPRTDPRRPPGGTATKPSSSDEGRKAQPPLGKLTKVSGQTYRTTAGLIYTPGSVDGHRLKHVARHFEDNPNKPVHGVFSGTERENFAAIDEAYLIATTDPRRTRTEKDRGRTIHKVNMKRKVGYIGGQSGRRKGKPSCDGIQLVLEDDRVITAYPIKY